MSFLELAYKASNLMKGTHGTRKKEKGVERKRKEWKERERSGKKEKAVEELKCSSLRV